MKTAAKFSLLLISALLILNKSGFSQSVPEELRGRYRFIYDSTYIWPDRSGGYDYIRRFVSEVTLAEKGREVLSRPATPVISKNDEIDIDAFTILPSGEVFDVETSDIVTRNYTDDSRRIFVNFRQAEPGATLHLEWTLKSKEGNTAGIRYFGRTIAVDSSIVVITAPETWIFNFIISPEYNTRQDKTTDKTAEGPAKVNYSWEASGLDGIHLEEFSPPVNRIIPALYFSLSLDVGWVNPDSQTVTWSRVAAIYDEKLNEFLKKNTSLNPISDSLVGSFDDELKIAESAYDWVTGNFRSLVPDISLSRNLNEAVERGRGSQGEAAAILYSLLKKSGISCSPYLATSREVGDPLKELPALLWFDRVLIACDIGSKTVWADPYYPVSELGILPYEDQNVAVLRIDERSEEFDYTPDIDYHQNGKAIHLQLDFDSTGAISGEATEIYSGAMIPEISSFMISLDEGQRKLPWERKLAKSFPGVKLLKFVAVPPDSSGEAYRVGYTFTTGPIVRPFATRAYIPMDLLGRWEDLPDLPDENREFPIELRNPRFEFERITLAISPPFQVEFTPKNFSLDSFIGEIYSVARKGENSVTITRGFGLKRSSLPASSYKSLRRFFNSARAEADKQIILIRRN